MEIVSSLPGGSLSVDISNIRNFGLKFSAAFSALNMYRLVHRDRWVKYNGRIFFPVVLEKLIVHYPVWDNVDDAMASIQEFADTDTVKVYQGKLDPTKDYELWVSYYEAK